MKISKTEIENYIPQRKPFIMIDNLVNAVPEKFETDFLVLPENIFVENGVLREFALIENIAQTS
jgi:predicted hotdog family 3-hydroxylacyl-ACP dehydratase